MTALVFDYWRLRSPIIKNGVEQPFKPIIQVGSKFINFYLYSPFTNLLLTLIYGVGMYNPQIQISAKSETKRSIFRKRDKTKRSKKESAQHSKSRNKRFVMTSVSAL